MVTRFPGGQDIARKWFVVDASGQTLGRLASRVASILAGKESALYTPFIDAGDHVIEGGAAPQRLRPRPQTQPGVNEKPDEKQRRRVEETTEAAGAFPRRALTHQDHGMDGLQLPLARNGEQRLQDIVGRGKEVVQHSSMREQRLDRVRAVGRKRLLAQRRQPLLDLARRR